jgi:hypothetical protein
MNIHSNIKKGMNDNFFIQGISIILQIVNAKWHLSFKLSYGHGFHAMIENNRTCATNWVGHDHIAISHVPCPINPYMLIVSSLSKQLLGRE